MYIVMYIAHPIRGRRTAVADMVMSFWDAQVWATAKLNQIPVVLSEDFASGCVIEGVQFENPFAGD